MVETTQDAYITLRLLAHEVEESPRSPKELENAAEGVMQSFITAKAVLLGMEVCLAEREWAESLVKLVADDVATYESAMEEATNMIPVLERMVEDYKILEEENDLGE